MKRKYLNIFEMAFIVCQMILIACVVFFNFPKTPWEKTLLFKIEVTLVLLSIAPICYFAFWAGGRLIAPGEDDAFLAKLYSRFTRIADVFCLISVLMVIVLEMPNKEIALIALVLTGVLFMRAGIIKIFYDIQEL